MLTDAFGRTVDYLRISVTDRCDLRCTYCLPKGFKGFSVPKEWLSIEELARVASAFARLGTKRVRLAAGEPEALGAQQRQSRGHPRQRCDAEPFFGHGKAFEAVGPEKGAAQMATVGNVNAQVH